MTLLTAIEPKGRRTLGDALRSVAWSPTGRTMALGADGRALLGMDGLPTPPIGPDPIDCCWGSVDRIAVVDGVLGVVVAGGGSSDVVPIEGALVARSFGQRRRESVARPTFFVVAGAGGLSVVLAEPGSVGQPVTIDTGPLRTAVHLGGPIWLGGGAGGLVVVDLDLGCIDDRVELPGVVSLAAAPEVGRVAAADSTGSIYVLELSDLEAGCELTGYPDAVQSLDIAPFGDFVVACTDDELSWWSVDASGVVADSPERGVGHDAGITCCEIGATGFVATGDADGVVRVWSPRLRDLPLGALHLGGEVTVLAWSPEGGQLAIGTATGEFVVADINVGELM